MTYFEGPFQALAHRGFAHASAGTEGLENSLAAFGAAVDLGYRYVETDAHGTSDGVAVALHDESLDRTTDGAGLVAELPWSEVREARIGGIEPVPLLEDLLAGWPQLRVNIDVKHVSGVGAVARAIERTASWGRVCVTSFDPVRRRGTLDRLSHPVATSAGRSEIRAFLAGVRLRVRPLARRALRDVDALQVPVRERSVTVVDAASVEAAHALGKKLHVWTINDPDEMARLIDEGVDGLITDRADLLKDLLVERGIWE
ncbi:glycerophosphoryl diester phosphodiesterase [Promicromonospora umidemergens]|uniref:Glycerophosphodiester phosphodiesterase n=1 Tax=Promicromonospora umidemergens TaxID=629679 RepID=A0ABP8XNQ3_9MICO|nr:glycerophosphodiester phosphodiesterase [Promicromonospora umidemergens]MCP2281846.1 glycerophosphoryl diester phosphodiesterase [Promicromonospora umidemergens]